MVVRSILIVAAALWGLSACAAGSSIEATSTDTVGSGSLPAVGDLDRAAAGDEPAHYSNRVRELVAKSAGAQEYNPHTLTFYEGWRLAPAAAGGTEWVVQRIGRLKRDGPRYLLVCAPEEQPPVGSVWTAVADFARGSWYFQDVSSPMRWEDRDLYVRCNIPSSVDPISPAGYLYMAVLAYDSGSSVTVDAYTEAEYEFDEPFLAPPLLLSAEWTGEDRTTVTFSAGPDFDMLQCSSMQIWRCEGGQWDADSAKFCGALFYAGSEPPTEYSIIGAGLDAFAAWTYRLCLSTGNGQGSEWSEAVTVPPLL